MSANKKKFCIFGIIFVVLLAILIPVLLTSVKWFKFLSYYDKLKNKFTH
jgi:hypothetical protein